MLSLRLKMGKKIAEVLFARILPGLINISTLIQLADNLKDNYGEFSTGFATATFLVIMGTGFILFAIIPVRARCLNDFEKKEFDRHILSLSIVISGFLAMVGIFAAIGNIYNLSWAGLVSILALYSCQMPVLRARLKLWHYGFTGLTASLTTYFLIAFLYSSKLTVENSVWAYAIGYAVGFLVGWMLGGLLRPCRIRFDSLKTLSGVGGSLTIANFGENSIYLGTRFVIFYYGTPAFLTEFSYAVDLAQRTAGLVINLISFAWVPRFYEASALSAKKAMLQISLAGVCAGTVAVVVAVVTASLSQVPFVGGLLGESFCIPCYILISIAVICNLVKKMVIDTALVNQGFVFAIPLGYFLVAPVVLILSLYSALAGNQEQILIVYPVGFFAVAVVTCILRLALGANWWQTKKVL